MNFSQQQRKWFSALVLCVGSAMALPAMAQPLDSTEVRGGKWPQASLQAEAGAEISQDTVKITLASEMSDTSQTAVAKALSKTLDSVMKDAKGDPAVKVSSGNYHVWPMNNEQGKITNWRGRGEIFLESQDFAAASELAGKLSDRMPIANLAFSVSPQARAKQEEALLSEAAQAFRDRAEALTKAFGFATYTVRNIDLGGAGARYESAPRMMSMAADKASVPLEGGTERVSVLIRGSIFLQSSQ
ncbi:DUF541 domain-containing protein [Candidimonas sp. SYP-B2681]|uniref:SIMPL domain-containing protein n=1 Tax=Candidimonas sp. SYP-B2681 TaxID=2497686 RepID=UPI000F89855B|nr:SIMPL domain-containing protein [Candidimonas sp. SYP-B2681]RTZ40067.1 DUF541 domain-containing protein [Candidimonas sp. SYP-B2681]